MTRLLCTLALLFLTVPAASAQTDSGQTEAEAVAIKDGDTPLIELRMFGIDTPEKDQLCERADGTCYACGREATIALMRMLLGEEATYRFTGAVTYGRPVARVVADGKDVNLEMVRSGWAVAYTRYLPASLKLRYLDAEEEARDAKRGIWQGRFIEPEKWRRGERLPCE